MIVKNRFTCEDIGEFDIQPNANLDGANLSRANLYRANLYGAILSRANLDGAKQIIAVGPIGSRSGITYAVVHKSGLMIKCGCFWGTFDEFIEKVSNTHGDNLFGSEYKLLIDFLRAWHQLHAEQPTD